MKPINLLQYSEYTTHKQIIIIIISQPHLKVSKHYVIYIYKYIYIYNVCVCVCVCVCVESGGKTPCILIFCANGGNALVLGSSAFIFCNK